MNELNKVMHLFRPINLLFIWVLQTIIFKYFTIDISYLNFIVYVILPTVFTAAAGYIINNFFDQKKDLLNHKPRLALFKKKTWLLLYLVFNALALVLSFSVEIKACFYLVLISQILLFLYAYAFSNWFLVGNFIVALLSFFTFLMVFISHKLVFVGGDAWVFCLSMFLLTFCREIVKDIADKKGDLKCNAQTMPIIFGNKWAMFFTNVFLFSNLGLLCSWAFINFYGSNNTIFLLYMFIVILGIFLAIFPLIYLRAEKWKVLALMYKIYMSFGLILIPTLSEL